MALTRLAATHLRKHLYLPAPTDGSSSSNGDDDTSNMVERSQFSHLERVCGDDDDDDEEEDNDDEDESMSSISSSSSGCLHFRNFAWLLVGGGLRRLQGGELFSPFDHFNRYVLAY